MRLMAELRFPEAGDRGRSTSATGRAVVAEAARAVDAELGERVAACADWRAGYVGAFRDLTAAGARSPQAPVAMARAGIDAVRARLEICERDAAPRPLADAFARDEPAPPTADLRGERERVRELAVPDGGELLRGDALRRRVEEWARDGVVEPGCVEAVGAVVANPGWLALEGRRVALLGAGAELGPLGPLAEWGADVLAVDLPGRRIWERIAGLAHAGAGTVRVALGARTDAALVDAAGIDLIGGLGALRTWLAQEGDGRPL